MNPTSAVAAALAKLGLPARDAYALETSEHTFDDGGQYGLEIASVQDPRILERVLAHCGRRDLRPARVIETLGIFRLSDQEIGEMVALAREHSIGLVLSIGPRAYYDTSASANTQQGSRVSYRLRGADNLAYALADVWRAVALGVRGLLVYDEGLLWTLQRMKQNGDLPSDLHLKVSVHCGHGNPASLRFLEELGAGSVNVLADLQLPMLAACRKAARVPIDIHTDTPRSSGGFIRTYEVPEMIRIAAPLFLKAGAVSAPQHAHRPSDLELEERVRQFALVADMIASRSPEARPITPASKSYALPAAR